MEISRNRASGGNKMICCGYQAKEQLKNGNKIKVVHCPYCGYHEEKTVIFETKGTNNLK